MLKVAHLEGSLLSSATYERVIVGIVIELRKFNVKVSQTLKPHIKYNHVIRGNSSRYVI